MNILLIEDNQGDIFLIGEILEERRQAYNINVKVNGKDAIDFINKVDASDPINFPEIIILDLNLPLVHGFEVLKEIKMLDKLSKIPVFIFSSSSEQSDREKAEKFGAAAYFAKPLDLEMYAATVDKFLNFQI